MISYLIFMQFHPVVKKIEDILNERGVWFERFEHEAVRTSEEAAAVRKGYTLAQGAKALVVRVKNEKGKQFVMIVVPGNRRFDTKKAKTVLGAKDVRFASPQEVAELTSGVVPGGVPPFGNLFGLDVYADESVVRNEKIIFNAGDKRVSIGMYATDYKEIVAPHVADIV